MTALRPWNREEQKNLYSCSAQVNFTNQQFAERGQASPLDFVPAVEVILLVGPQKQLLASTKVHAKISSQYHRPGMLDESDKRLSDSERAAVGKVVGEGHDFEAIRERPFQRNPEGRLFVPTIKINVDSESLALVAPELEKERPWDLDPQTYREISFEVKSPQPGASTMTIYRLIKASLKRGGQAPLLLIDARYTAITEEMSYHAVTKLLKLFQTHWNERPVDRLNELRILGPNFDHLFLFINEEKVVKKR